MNQASKEGACRHGTCLKSTSTNLNGDTNPYYAAHTPQCRAGAGKIRARLSGNALARHVYSLVCAGHRSFCAPHLEWAPHAVAGNSSFWSVSMDAWCIVFLVNIDFEGAVLLVVFTPHHLACFVAFYLLPLGFMTVHICASKLQCPNRTA